MPSVSCGVVNLSFVLVQGMKVSLITVGINIKLLVLIIMPRMIYSACFPLALVSAQLFFSSATSSFVCVCVITDQWTKASLHGRAKGFMVNQNHPSTLISLPKFSPNTFKELLGFSVSLSSDLQQRKYKSNKMQGTTFILLWKVIGKAFQHSKGLNHLNLP